MQEEQWLRLNDDLLQWQLLAKKAEKQVEKVVRIRDMVRRMDIHSLSLIYGRLK